MTTEVPVPSESRTRALLRLSLELNSTGDVSEVAAAAARAVLTVRAFSVLLSLVDETVGKLVTLGLDDAAPDLADKWRDVDLSADIPALDVIRTGKPLWVLSERDRGGRWAASAADAAEAKVQSFCVLPLTAAGHTFGTLLVLWHDDLDLSTDEREWLLAIASTVGQAAARAREFERNAHAIKRAEQLHDLSVVLNSATSPVEVARAVSAAAVRITNSVESGLYAVDDEGGQLRLACVGAVSPGTRASFDRIGPDDVVPAMTAMHTRTAQWLEDLKDWAPYSELAETLQNIHWPTCAVLPLTKSGQVLGTLYATFPPGRRLQPSERRFLLTMAELGTAALARCNQRVAEQALSDRLDRTEARLVQLSEFGGLGIIQSDGIRIFDANAAFLRMLDLPALLEGGLAWTAITPPPWIDVGSSVFAQLRETGRCEPFETEYLRSDRSTVPVSVTLTVTSREPFELIGAVTDLTALRSAQASELRQRDDRERVATALQRSLLPVLRVANGPRHGHELEVKVAYRPGDKRLTVGGDFYDAITLTDGRTALLIGDVSGHGPESAAVGAVLRASWRAYTLGGMHNESILDALDVMLTSERSDPHLFATVVSAVISADGREFHVAAAGHPAPILRTSDSISSLDLVPALPLGVTGPRTRPPRSGLPVVAIAAPDHYDLLLYTDGLTDGFSGANGRERLDDVGLIGLLNSDPSLMTQPRRLIDLVNSLHGGDLPDDVAVLAASRRQSSEH